MSHSHQQQPSPEVEALGLPPNQSCLLVQKRTVSVEPIAHPALQPDGVLVRVMANGICGSDMHAYLAGGVGGRPIVEPTVMGHEAAGEVIAVGAQVTTHKVGDRVAIEPGLPCRKCPNCKNGRSNICPDIRYCGAPGTHGSLSKFFALPADMAPKIPEGISWDEAGCLQPLAIGVQIGKRADIKAHQTIAIFGCGPIGLITAAVSHAYSARKIIAFDINPARVEFARNYKSPLTGRPVIDHVILIKPIPAKGSATATNGLSSAPDGELATGDAHEEQTEGDRMWGIAQERMQRVMEEHGLVDEDGVDRVIEASGAQDAMLHGIALCKPGGTFLQLGLGHVQTHIFPTIAVTNKDLTVNGITRYTASCFPSAIEMVSRGVVDLKQLITVRFPMSRAKDAFEAVAGGKEIKVIIKNQEA